MNWSEAKSISKTSESASFETLIENFSSESIVPVVPQFIEIPPLYSALALNPLIDALGASFDCKGASMSKNCPAGNTGPERTAERTDLVESSSLLVAPSARS